MKDALRTILATLWFLAALASDVPVIATSTTTLQVAAMRRPANVLSVSISPRASTVNSANPATLATRRDRAVNVSYMSDACLID